MAEETVVTVETPSEEKSDTIAEVVETVAEVVANSEPETSDNDVAIAAIQADKEVQIAEIEGDTRKEESRNYQSWTEENLRSMIREEVSLAIAPLLPVSSQSTEAEIVEVTEEAAEAIAEELTETLMETNGTSESTVAHQSETQMEVGERNEEEGLAPPVLEIGGKPIIKLV